jgi:hypothetical protein
VGVGSVKESRYSEDLGGNTWQVGGVVMVKDSDLLDIEAVKVGGERLRAGPASGEERMGLVWLPSADLGRGTFAMGGGMSSAPELYWSIF